MRSVCLGAVLMTTLAGCALVAEVDPVSSDGLDCEDGGRVGWALDYAAESVPVSSTPADAVRDVVDVEGAELVVGEERDRADVVSVDVVVARDGRAVMRVEVRQAEDGWVADNVQACD